jgi:hypothetical protein
MKLQEMTALRGLTTEELDLTIGAASLAAHCASGRHFDDAAVTDGDDGPNAWQNWMQQYFFYFRVVRRVAALIQLRSDTCLTRVI